MEIPKNETARLLKTTTARERKQIKEVLDRARNKKVMLTKLPRLVR